MREHDLYEASFGSNDQKFNDGKVKYVAEKRAFTLVSKVSDKLFVVVLVYLDGRVLMSTTNNPNAYDVILGSIDQLMNPSNINKAYQYYDVVTDMIKTIVEKFYSRFNSLKFVAVSSADLNKLERYLKKPEVMHFLEIKRFEYVEHKKQKDVNLVVFQKQ